jgi:hypothetical protein
LIRQIISEPVDFGTHQKTLGDKILLDLRKNIDDQIGNISGKFDEANGPASNTKDILDKARNLWKQQLGVAETAKKFDLSDENVVKKTFSSLENVRELKNSVPENVYNEAVTQHLYDTLQSKVNANGNLSPGSALRVFRDKAPVLKEALGAEKYKNVVDVLDYMNRTGISNFNPSKTKVLDLMTGLGSLKAGAILGTTRALQKTGSVGLTPGAKAATTGAIQGIILGRKPIKSSIKSTLGLPTYEEENQ